MRKDYFFVGWVTGLLILCSLCLELNAQNNALEFNGSSSYVTFGQAMELNSQNFTVEIWFKRTGPGTSNTTGNLGIPDMIPILAKGAPEADGSAVDANYILGIDASAGVLAADFEEGSGSESPGLNHPLYGSTPIINDIWYHAAATFNSGVFSLFLNGELENSLSLPGVWPQGNSTQHAALATMLKSNGTNGNPAGGYFAGVLDEARIWDYAQTQSEIQSNMLLEVTSGTGLLGRWGMNEGSGGSIANSVSGSSNGTLEGSPAWVAGSPFEILETLTFQEGVNSYTGTIDTHIFENDPTPSPSYGTYDYIKWDLSSGGGTMWALIRFDDIFGTGGSQIPVGASIHSAILSYNVVNEGDPGDVYEVLVDWDEDVNYSNFGGEASVQPDEYGTLINSADGASGITTYPVLRQVDLTASLITWSANPSLNKGWIFIPPQDNGTNVASGEHATVSNRPMLTVVFADNPPTTIPDPPSDMAADETATLQVDLSWTDNSDNESGFEIERSVTGVGGTYSLLTTVPANSTSYIDYSVDALSEYCYQVRAVNVIGESGYTNADCATTPDDPGTALDLGSGNAYVTFGDPDELDLAEFTLETWFKKEGAGSTANTGSGGVLAIPLVTKGVGQSESSDVDLNYFLGIRGSDNVLAADFEEGDLGSNESLNHPVLGTTTIVNDTWYHAAVTYDGNKWQLFLNGELENELVVGEPVASASTQHAGLGVALTSTGGDNGHFDGVLDEVRIWDYARTQAEIKTTINDQITSSPSGLAARWGLNEGSGTTINSSIVPTVNGTINNTGSSWVAGGPFNLIFNDPPEAILEEPLDASTDVTVNPTLSVTVSDPELENMTVTFYGRKKSEAGEDFTIVGLPDTQHYTDGVGSPDIFYDQTDWIVENQVEENIAFVSHFGDLVEDGDSQESQWTIASTAMYTLEDPNPELPYGIALGNHDMDGGTTLYNTYFGTSHFSAKPYYGGSYGSDNNYNYELFSAGGMDFIIFHLAYEASSNSDILNWADALLVTHSDRRAIITSHYILGSNGSFSSQGQILYDKFKDNPNVFLMLCGHVTNEARRSDTYNGNVIHSLLADYQGRTNGGNGWLRIMEFSPQNNEISVKTYSPWLNQWETDDNSQFTLAYEMGGSASKAPFELLGSVPGVTSGTIASISWSDLSKSTEYEWYVTIDDGVNTTNSDIWTFTTETGPVIQLTDIPLSPFTTVAGTPSAVQNYTLDGSYLEGNIQVTAPVDFTISLSENSGFTGSLNIVPGDLPVPIYVKFNSAIIGSYNGFIVHESINAGTENLSVSAQATAEPLVTWVALNDLNGISGDLNASYVSRLDYNSTNAALNDSVTNSVLAATMTGSYNTYEPKTGNGGQANALTDAGIYFGTSASVIVDLTRTIELDDQSYFNEISFNNLDPDELYDVILTANRDNPEYTGRWTRVTIEGAEGFINKSSNGVSVSNPSNFENEFSVSFCTGYNTVNGYVARWSNIAPGIDGSFSIKSEREMEFGASTSDTDKGYAMGAFRLAQLATSTAPVVNLSGIPLSPFSANTGVYSAEQEYSVNGANLENDITITVPADFEASTTSGSGFDSELILPHVDGIVDATTIYVRFMRPTPGTSSGDLLHESSPADTKTLSLMGVAGPPAAPADLSATAISSSQIDLLWLDNSDNELNFVIERSMTGSDGTYNWLATVDANTTAYSDLYLSAETEYCYRVMAVNTVDNSTYTNPDCDITLFETGNQGAVSFAVFGDFGDPNANNGLTEQAVADLVMDKAPELIITTGDNNYFNNPSTATWDEVVGDFYYPYIKYPSGSTSDHAGNGVVENKFFPSFGNHDWDAGGQTEYFDLPGNERYYTFTQGPVQFFCIDSDTREPDGTSETSIQALWLQEQLAASVSVWKIVYDHHPPYSSSSSHGSTPYMQWPFEDWGVDVVFSGHDHLYERIIRDENADGTDLPYIISGAGGKSLYGFSTPLEGSEVRIGNDGTTNNYGTVIVNATSTTMIIEFWTIEDGGTLQDTYEMSRGIESYCEDFESFTVGQTIGASPEWFDEGTGPVIQASNGIGGFQGLDPSTSIFTWVEREFDWNAINLQDVYIQMDFKTDASAQFDDRRIGWMIDDASTNSDLIFGIQLDNAGDHLRMEGYWDHEFEDDLGRIEMVDLDPIAIAPDSWYRLKAEFTRLDATSAKIIGNLWLLDGTGEIVELTATGSILNTADVGAGLTPNPAYFTGPMWPAFKVHEGILAPADNACFGIITNGLLIPPDAPTELNASENSYNEIGLSWSDNSDNESNFKIERSVNGEFGPFTVVATVAANSESYLDSGLNPETEYCYRLRASNSGGASDYTNTDCASTPEGPYTISFRQGVNAYSGNIDTYLSEDEATSTHGTLESFEWDSDDPSGTSQEKFALIRFDDLFGGATGQIPEGAVIHEAIMTITVFDQGVDGMVNEVLSEWTEGETFSGFGTEPGVQAEDYGNFIGIAPGTVNTHDIDVTSSLSNWSADPIQNRGWIIRPVGTNGVDARSSEYDSENVRPLLTVLYSDPPTEVPANPDNLLALAMSYSMVELSWNDNANNEANFEIHRSIDGSGGPYTLIATLGANSNSYQDQNLDPENEYCYKVMATNIIGSSAFSNTSCTETFEGPVYALECDGVNDRVVVPFDESLNLSTDFTVSVWVKPTAFGGYRNIINRGDRYNPNYQFWIGFYGEDLYFDFKRANNYYILNPSSSMIGYIDTWIHIALVYEESEKRATFFLNGEEFATTFWYVDILDESIRPLHIGGDPEWNQWFPGDIDEVKIWNSVRTIEQIQEYMHKEIDDPTSEVNLMAYYRFNEGTGQDVFDLSSNGNHGTLGVSDDLADDDPIWVVSTAPVPYYTISNGIYANSSVWAEGQNSPLNEWSRIRVSHQINMDANHSLIEASVYPTGDLLVQEGITLQVRDHLDIDGTFSQGKNTLLQMGELASINVGSGGQYYILGTSGNESMVTNNGAGYYSFNVQDGGLIGAEYAVFEDMDINGLYVAGEVDPNYPFDQCAFQNGANGGVLITLNGSQNISLGNINFPTNTWGSNFNISKTMDVGSVLIANSSGDFSGEVNENDPYDRIAWDSYRLDLTAFVEGPFNGTDMDLGLNSVLPLDQPFSGYPWYYGGTETAASIPANAVDWVLVELRDAPSAAEATAGTSVFKGAAFITANGEILDVDGLTKISFETTISNQLFVVIWTRNYLPVLSADPLSSLLGEYTYDFTTGWTAYYGGIEACKEIGANIWGLMGGDGNASGIVDAIDETAVWAPDAGKSGYLKGDFNLDGEVDNADKNEIWLPNLNKESQLPE